jgi:S-DNA-T family DNA segregation ATPase FtsK/SpoIIIE
VPPLEFQVALPPADSADEAAVSIEALGQYMTLGMGTSIVPRVQDLPRWISATDPRLCLGDSPGQASSRLPVLLGLDDETDGPLRLDLADTHHVLVVGPAGSGKTSLLATCLLSSLAHPRGRAARWYLACPRASALSELQGLGNWAGFARTAAELNGLLSELEREINTRRERFHGDHTVGAGEEDQPLLLVLDDYDVLGEDDDFPLVQSALSGLAKRGRLVGLHILLAGFNIELRRFNNVVAQQLAQVAAGILLQPDADADGDLFGVRLRRLSGEVPPGRGYLVRRRQHRLFQAATYQPEGGLLAEGVRDRVAAPAALAHQPATAG